VCAAFEVCVAFEVCPDFAVLCVAFALCTDAVCARATVAAWAVAANAGALTPTARTMPAAIAARLVIRGVCEMWDIVASEKLTQR
jgi:hypothetical protein